MDGTYTVLKISFTTRLYAQGKDTGPDIFHFVVFFFWTNPHGHWIKKLCTLLVCTDKATCTDVYTSVHIYFAVPVCAVEPVNWTQTSVNQYQTRPDKQTQPREPITGLEIDHPTQKVCL